MKPLLVAFTLVFFYRNVYIYRRPVMESIVSPTSWRWCPCATNHSIKGQAGNFATTTWRHFTRTRDDCTTHAAGFMKQKLLQLSLLQVLNERGFCFSSGTCSAGIRTPHESTGGELSLLTYPFHQTHMFHDSLELCETQAALSGVRRFNS